VDVESRAFHKTCVDSGAGLTRSLPDPAESALPAFLVITLAALFLNRERPRVSDTLLPLCILCGGALLYVVACNIYFHSALPLAFYVKGHNYYPEYIGEIPYCGPSSSSRTVARFSSSSSG